MQRMDYSSIDIRELSLKWTSKRKVYQTLAVTGNVYLPPIDQVNWDFISDVLTGDKKVGWWVHLLIVSQRKRNMSYPCSSCWGLENSRNTWICKRSLRHWRLHASLWKWEIPLKKVDMKCRYKLHFTLLYLVCTLISDKFHDFVEQKIVESNSKNDQNTNAKFSVLLSFAKVFDETNFVSSKVVCLNFKERRGRFHQLAKNSKRRRDNIREHENKEIEDKAMKDHINEQEEIIESLNNKLDECKQKIEDYQRDTDIHQKLYQNGYIDLDGNPKHEE